MTVKEKSYAPHTSPHLTQTQSTHNPHIPRGFVAGWCQAVFFPGIAKSARDTRFVDFFKATFDLARALCRRFSQTFFFFFKPLNRKIFLFLKFFKGTFSKNYSGTLYRSHEYFFEQYHGQIKKCHGENKTPVLGARSQLY